MNPVVPAIGLLAATVGITVSAPQVLRLLRSPNADGLSPGSAVLGLLATSTWLTYGVLIVDLPQILANVPGLTGAVAIHVLVVRRAGLRWGPGLAAAAGWAVLVAGVFLAQGAQSVGLLATAVTLVARVPQVHTVFRTTSLTALSRTSVLLGTASASLWLAYGILTHDLPVWTSSSAVLALSALILGRQAYVLRTTVAPAPAPGAAPEAAPEAASVPAQRPIPARSMSAPLTPATVPLPRISADDVVTASR